MGNYAPCLLRAKYSRKSDRILRFNDEQVDPLQLRTRPVIRLTWNVTALGVW